MKLLQELNEALNVLFVKVQFKENPEVPFDEHDSRSEIVGPFANGAARDKFVSLVWELNEYTYDDDDDYALIASVRSYDPTKAFYSPKDFIDEMKDHIGDDFDE